MLFRSHLSGENAAGSDVDLSVASMPEGFTGFFKSGSYEVSRVHVSGDGADAIATFQTTVPADAAAFTLLKESLVEVLGTLTEREQKVLRLRFGLDDGRARTLEEVGKEFNVTRERIRQIEAKALRKLRHPSRSRKLKDYLD